MDAPGPLTVERSGVEIHPATSTRAFLIDANGLVVDRRVTPAIAKTIERGPMASVRGLIVHQTGGSTAQSSLESYQSAGANGAHFLIDKDGTIYQTASIFQRTWHVGRLKARCLLQKTCSPTEVNAYSRFNPAAMNRSEAAKSVPDRFPSNEDAVGIELVGATIAGVGGAPETYEAVTDAQNLALKWLIGHLAQRLGVPITEIFRHPDVSWKNSTEANTARW